MRRSRRFATHFRQSSTTTSGSAPPSRAGNPDAAHDDLHAIGHLLEDLPKLVGTAGVAIDRTAVDRSAGNLFDAFSRIDDKIHGGTGSTYAEEAKTISKELAAFRAFLAEHRP
jgi:hypothetical protein